MQSIAQKSNLYVRMKEVISKVMKVHLHGQD